MRQRFLLGCLLFLWLTPACDDTGSNPGSTGGSHAVWSQLSGGVGESNFRQVWGASLDTILAVGEKNSLARSIEGQWNAVPLPGDSVSLRALWAYSGSDIYVAGVSGVAFHFDGNAWTSTPAPTATSFIDLCGTFFGEVFACVEDANVGYGVMQRSANGWDWFVSDLPELKAIWATSTQAIYVAGLDGYVGRFDGVEWKPASRSGGFAWLDAWGAPDDDVYFVGEGGHIGRYFYAFNEVTSPVTSTLHALSGTSVTNIVAVGNEGTILRFDGMTWRTETSGTVRNLLAVHMFDDGTAVALGELGTVLSSDGNGWHVAADGQLPFFVDAFGFDAHDVFFAGRQRASDGVVQHLDGRTWTFPGTQLNGIWGAAPDNLVVVGDLGVGFHFNGVTWTQMTNASMVGLDAVSGATSDAISRAYTVGKNANIRYANAPYASWSAMAPPSTGIYDVRDVWAASPDNVFAVGPSSTILRYRDLSALRWVGEDTGLTGVHFTAITGRSGTDVTAVTDDGRVCHFDGMSWSQVVVPSAAPWVHVACGDRGSLLAVSSLPHKVMITGFGAAPNPSPVYLGPFNCGWVTDGTAYVAGGEGTVFRYTW